MDDKNNLPIFLLAIFCLVLTFAGNIELLGLWETSSIFHTFAPETNWLNTLIHPRANIGGYEYALLDLSRYITSVLGFNLFSIRLLPMLYGLVSLYFFFQILMNWMSRSTAIIVTLLLALNPLFFIFQHQLNISIVTFTVLLMCIYGFQKVEAQPESNKSIWFFATACALATLHYQIGRYCMLAIVLFWFTKGLELNKEFEVKKLWLLDRDKNSIYIKFVIAFFIILFLLHPFNVFVFLNINFLAPLNGEVALGTGTILESLKVNIPLLIHSLFGTSNYYGDNYSDLIVSVPYPTFNMFLMIPLLIGLISLFRVKESRNALFVTYLLALTIMPLSLSSIFPGTISTLSSYRQFYMIIPLYILIAFGFDYGINKLKKYKILFLLFGAILIIYQSFDKLYEYKRFNKFLHGFICNFNYDDSGRKYICELPELYDDVIVYGDSNKEGYRYLPISMGLKNYRENMVPLWKYSQSLANKINNIENHERYYIVDAPASDFEKYGASNGHMYKYNSSSLLLALYLSSNGVNINYLVPYTFPRNSFFENLINMYRTKYLNMKEDGAKRNSYHLKMPLLMDDNKNDYASNAEYKSIIVRIKDKFDKYAHNSIVANIRNILVDINLFKSSYQKYNGAWYFDIRSTSHKSDNLYLATTNSEMKYIKEILESNELPYSIIKLQK